MKILFIIREKNDLSSLLKTYEGSQLMVPDEVTLLLIHDAVFAEPNSYSNFKIFACEDDVKARNIDTLFDTLDYAQILRLISDCRKVICW